MKEISLDKKLTQFIDKLLDKIGEKAFSDQEFKKPRVLKADKDLALEFLNSAIENEKNNNFENAIQDLKQSSIKYNTDAMYKLANYYLSGEYIEKDKVFASKLLFVSATLGNNDADILIEKLGNEAKKQEPKNTDYQPKYYIFLDENIYLKYLKDRETGLDFLKVKLVGEIKVIVPKCVQEILKKSDKNFYNELIDKEVVELYEEEGDLVDCAEKYRHDEFPKKIVISENYKLIYKALQIYSLDIELPLNSEFQILNSYMFRTLNENLIEDAKTDDYAKMIFVYNNKSLYPEQVFEYSQYLSDKKNPFGEFQLGYCYQRGIGCEPDLEKAIEYYEKSASQNYSDAELQLGSYEYSKSEYSEKTINWLLKSSNHGNCIAQNNLGNYYRKIDDYETAFKYYSLSSQQGNIDAMYYLSMLYKQGAGCEKNLEKSFYWIKLASEKGDSDAQFSLGFCYYSGSGCEKDETKAFEWFKKSAEQGNKVAQYNVGLCYEQGIGCETNGDQAFIWIQKSAKQGYQPAIEKYDSMDNLLKYL
ncbi:MAG: sel1 repeat family protein [Bacteroidales bacterium]|nr:sel1 repeat family protein [Bacteroidales bacterium]